MRLKLILCHISCSDAQVWVGHRSTAIHSWSERVWASHSQSQVTYSKLNQQYVKLNKTKKTFVWHRFHLTAPFSILCRYTFGKPVTGKLTVNMTVNGVGYYRHEMGHPVIKTMEVRLVIIICSNLTEEHWLNWYVGTKYFPSCWNAVISPLSSDQRFCKLQPVCQGHDASGCGWSLQGLCEHLGVSDEHRREQANHLWRLNAGP